MTERISVVAQSHLHEQNLGTFVKILSSDTAGRGKAGNALSCREACGNRMTVLPVFDPLDLAAFLVVRCLLLLRLQLNLY